jgi:uncharacterized protein YllA (UPF0747 family)
MQHETIRNQTKRAACHDKKYWQEVITSWQKSGESQKNFCARMNIKMGTFFHWRNIFAKGVKKSKNKFIELQVAQEYPEKLENFIIECPSGHKIVFSSLLQLDQAEKLFKLLGLVT